MFHVIDEHFFMPLASPNRVVYWECICKLFSVMDHQLSFGVDRDVLVEELQYYFEQTQAAELSEEELTSSASPKAASASDFCAWEMAAYHLSGIRGLEL